MNDILKEFGVLQESSKYIFGWVLEVISPGIYSIRTDTGLEVTLHETIDTYLAGEQVILTTQKNDLNSLFALRKVVKALPTAINFVIDNGTD